MRHNSTVPTPQAGHVQTCVIERELCIRLVGQHQAITSTPQTLKKTFSKMPIRHSTNESLLVLDHYSRIQLPTKQTQQIVSFLFLFISIEEHLKCAAVVAAAAATAAAALSDAHRLAINLFKYLPTKCSIQNI